MLERQVSVALEGGHGVEDDLEKAFDSELLRIVQFYQKKVWPERAVQALWTHITRSELQLLHAANCWSVTQAADCLLWRFSHTHCDRALLPVQQRCERVCIGIAAYPRTGSALPLSCLYSNSSSLLQQRLLQLLTRGNAWHCRRASCWRVQRSWSGWSGKSEAARAGPLRAWRMQPTGAAQALTMQQRSPSLTRGALRAGLV